MKLWLIQLWLFQQVTSFVPTSLSLLNDHFYFYSLVEQKTNYRPYPQCRNLPKNFLFGNVDDFITHCTLLSDKRCAQFSTKIQNGLLSLGSIPHKHQMWDNISKEQEVQVWDGVLSRDSCEELHELAWDHNDRVESSIFTRKIRQKGNQKQLNDDDEFSKKWTVLERAIDSILTAIEENDTIDNEKGENNLDDKDFMVVEYWSRQHHMNVDVHSDIDERQLLEEGTVRTPKKGHILYLIVGEEILENGGSPTVIFPGRKELWNRNNHHQQQSQEAHQDLDSTTATTLTPLIEVKDTEKTEELVTIPAVNGRLVRFNGQMMHAVPCPSLTWLHNRNEMKNPKYVEQDHLDEEDYHDPEEFRDTENEQLRSVLIFNTWPSKDGPPPKGVDPDPGTGLIPNGIELGDGGDIEFDDYEFDDEFDDEEEPIFCQHFTQWKKAPVNQYQCSNDINNFESKIPLLGNVARRGHEESFVEMLAPAYLRTALTDLHTVSKLSMLIKEEN